MNLDITVLWGILLTSATLKCWIAQILIAFSPKIALQLKLLPKDLSKEEKKHKRTQAQWDTLSLWVLPAAGILLIIQNKSWYLAGLLGSGIYIYFAGRGIVTNRTLSRPKKEDAFLLFWAGLSIITIVLAVLTAML